MKLIFEKLDSILIKRSHIQIILFCLLLVALILKVNILSGHELFILLLIPVAISTWYGSHRTGIFFSILTAVLWLYVDVLAFETHYVNPLAPRWNAVTLLGFFLITEELLNCLKAHLVIEKAEARKDDLTQLFNVRGFTEQAEKLFGLAARHNRDISLIYIDLDDFRKMNVQFGKNEGDRLLRVVGKKTASSLRASDVAGRIGGGEIAIVLPETDEVGARAMVDAFRLTLLQEMEKNHWPVSFSMGVMTFNSPRANLDDAVKIGASLMRRAKENGKDNIVFGSYPVK